MGMFSRTWQVSSPRMTMLDKVSLKPYTNVDITVTAFTTWGTARPVGTTLQTPESVPTRPQQVRVVWTIGLPNRDI